MQQHNNAQKKWQKIYLVKIRPYAAIPFEIFYPIAQYWLQQ